ncbi:hypothetical protein J6590_003097 [Homalodisca vitripennis]|nr:hypothetical protein J6590_003097 [Homalodisca vitripennis]
MGHLLVCARDLSNRLSGRFDTVQGRLKSGLDQACQSGSQSTEACISSNKALSQSAGRQARTGGLPGGGWGVALCRRTACALPRVGALMLHLLLNYAPGHVVLSFPVWFPITSALFVLWRNSPVVRLLAVLSW